MNGRNGHKSHRAEARRLKKQKNRLIFFGVLLLIVIAACLGLAYRIGIFDGTVNRFFAESTPDTTPRTTPKVEDEIQGSLPQQKLLDEVEDEVINILLVGLDTRSEDEFTRGLADAIMLLSLNTTKNEIKMVSVMRDLLVEVPWGDYDKINSYTAHDAGIQGLMDVFSSHLSVPIDHYAVTNFSGLATIIDIFGGVNVDVSSSELEVLNNEIKYINSVDSKNPNSVAIVGTGIQHLDGKQAVAYSRIRKIDSDLQRTSRQREVLMGLKSNIKELSMVQLIELANKMPDYMKTDMSLAEMIGLVPAVYKARTATIEELTLPIEGLEKQGRYNDRYVIRWDYEDNTRAVLKFLYDVDIFSDVDIE